MSRWCVYDWLKRQDLEPAKQGSLGPWKLTPKTLAAHVAAYPNAYQYERAEALGVSQYMIGVSLKRLGLKTFRYREKDDEGGKVFLKQLNAVPENKRVYVDETGFNEPLIREYAYAKRGERMLGECTGKRFARTSLIAGL